MIDALIAHGSGLAGRMSRRSASRRLRGGLALSLTALLVACGGGGSGDGGTTQAEEIAGPPVSAAALANSAGEAQRAAQAVVAGADAAANRVSALNGLSVLVGNPVLPQSAVAAPRRQLLGVARARPLAVQTATCADVLDPPCSGSATLDTNIADSATRANAGDYADMQFAALSGSLFGQQVVMNGRMRIDFLSVLDLNATSFSGLDLKLKLESFGGTVNGASFGPISDTSRFQISAQGVATVIAAGASYSDLHGVAISGAGSYSIAGGTVRVGYWGDAGKYVDLTLQNWRVVGGRPAVGSQATVSSGQGSATLTVTSSSTTAVVSSLTINAAGSTTRYIVTATYPAGGGAPTYVAVVPT